MKTRTSIPFGALSGSAGVVTARSTRFGTILSGRAHQPGKVTPQQKDMRALFARVGRSFGRLNPMQVEAWALFAEAHNFGSRMQAKSPAVNAYVTLNCNRALLGLEMLMVPPTEIPAIPEVKAFFERMDSDAVTLSPYMGGDAILPFLSYRNKWVILLALTSNVTAVDFETMPTVEQSVYQYEPQVQVPMYERVIRKASQWGSKENIMFVVGATRPEQLARIRQICPDNFFLVPGVGAQGGTVEEVARAGMNSSCGLLVNSSRGIIYADSTEKFAETAALKAEEMASEMKRFLEK